MGWTYTHKEKGQTVKEFFEKHFNSDVSKIIDCKVVGMRTAYICYQSKRGIEALVCLLGYKKNEYCNFGYKDMTETINPYYYDCPKSILDKLSPTTNEYALEWRAKCQEVIVKSEARKSLEVSDTIKFEREFSFGKYGKTDTFVVVDKKKGHYFAPKFHINVKLTKTTVNNTPWVKI